MYQVRGTTVVYCAEYVEAAYFIGLTSSRHPQIAPSCAKLYLTTAARAIYRGLSFHVCTPSRTLTAPAQPSPLTTPCVEY